jgi:hypothetical protein
MASETQPLLMAAPGWANGARGMHDGVSINGQVGEWQRAVATHWSSQHTLWHVCMVSTPHSVHVGRLEPDALVEVSRVAGTTWPWLPTLLDTL